MMGSSSSSDTRTRILMGSSSSSDTRTRILMGVNKSSIKGYPYASISSRKAFQWTVDKIVSANSAAFKILFLHVQQLPVEDGFDDMDNIYASPEDFVSVKRRDKLRGLHLLEYFVRRCHEYVIPCEAWIKRGDPKEVICSEVKRVQPDLLVVGNRGIGPYLRLLVGTVSGYCVNQADCPVLTIKREAEEAPQDPIDD